MSYKITEAVSEAIKQAIEEDEDLAECYDSFNKKFFNNELKSCPIGYGTLNGTGLAVTRFDKDTGEVKQIVFSSICFDLSDKEFFSTLMHEMIHVYVLQKIAGDKDALDEYIREGGHTALWHKMANAFNDLKKFNITVRADESLLM